MYKVGTSREQFLKNCSVSRISKQPKSSAVSPITRGDIVYLEVYDDRHPEVISGNRATDVDAVVVLKEHINKLGVTLDNLKARARTKGIDVNTLLYGIRCRNSISQRNIATWTALLDVQMKLKIVPKTK